MIHRTLFIVLLLAGTAFALPPPRDARHVIFRGARKLEDALHTASAAVKGRTGTGSRGASVAIVVDVTPNTRAAAPRLRRALDRLGDRLTDLRGRWRIAPLGGRFGKVVRNPSALALEINRVLAVETRVTNTMRALTRTLADFRDRGGIVVYLADCRFEDHDLLEGFIGRL
ncbi:MAG: hypothetical protein GY704_10000, partial [Phycisphaeraceae bacterium]|nr:hypothetical protein [Phycisphaeraceae bacterium]